MCNLKYQTFRILFNEDSNDRDSNDSHSLRFIHLKKDKTFFNKYLTFFYLKI